MPRYIDADEAIKYLNVIKKHNDRHGIILDADEESIIDFFRERPTADVQEVKHGRWTFLEQKPLVDFIKCSICDHITRDCWADVTGGTIKMKSKRPNYCPHCGAKMDEEDKKC